MKTFKLLKMTYAVASIGLLINTAHAICPSGANTSRYITYIQLSKLPIGSEVYDMRTQKIWLRCTVGQTWNGKTCTGTAKHLGWVDAYTYPKTKAIQDGLNWRLPTKDEQLSIVDEGCFPRIDPKIFPNTMYKPFSNDPLSKSKYWTTSIFYSETLSQWYSWVIDYSGSSLNGDIASLDIALSIKHSREEKNYIRLIRDIK